MPADDEDDVRSTNQDFRMSLYAAAHAPRLEPIIKNLWATFPRDTPSLAHDRSITARREHAAMLDAVRAHDGEWLDALVAQHIESAAQQLLAPANAVKHQAHG